MQSRANDTTYPYNLLDDIAGVKWEYSIPDDIEQTVEYLLASFPYREREIIHARYVYNKKLTDIGIDYNVSGERVRQIVSKIIRKLSMQSSRVYLLLGIRRIIENAAKDGTITNLNTISADISRIAKELERLSPCSNIMLDANGLMQKSINIKIRDAGFSTRSMCALLRYFCSIDISPDEVTLDEITQLTETELRGIEGIGSSSCYDIMKTLDSYGLRLKQED